MNSLSDEQLMQQYAIGDMAAFSALFSKHKGGLYRYFLRHTGDKGLAEDLYQDVWNKVIDSAENYQPTAKFTTWLYALAHNTLVDHVRHLTVVNKVFESAPLDEDKEAEQADSVPEVLEQGRASDALKNCLTKLPQLQLDSFLLKEEAGMTAAEIATVVGASLEATKSRLRYAYQSLRDCISLRIGKVVA